MSTNKDKQNRKRLLQDFKQQEKEKKLAQMPMAVTDLRDLFDYLNEQLQEEDCDNSLTLTEAFLREKGLPIKRVTDWLQEHGGYCDCEVLANVEDEFDGIV